MSLQEWFASSLTGAALHRPRELREDPPRRPALPRGGRAHHLLHRSWPSPPRRCSAWRWRCCSTGSSGGAGLLRTLAILPMVATPTAIALVFVMMYHPTLGVANYLLVGRRPVAVPLDLLEPDRALRAGAGGRLAVDAAHHADRAGRPRQPAARALRGRAHRRRHDAAGVLAHHAAAAPAHPRRGDPVPGHRRAQDLRHHLRHDPGRARPTRRRRSTSCCSTRRSPTSTWATPSSMAVALFALVMGASLILIKVRRTAAW